VGQATAAREGLLERFAQWYRDNWAANTTDVAVAIFAESPLAEKIFFERMVLSIKYRATFNRLPQAAREFIGEGRFLSKWQARWSSRPGRLVILSAGERQRGLALSLSKGHRPENRPWR